MLLTTYAGTSIRPSSSRLRESLFNILTSSYFGIDWSGIRVLDLCAGSGALGLEALSRGASFCHFIDHARSSRMILARNIKHLGYEACTKIHNHDVASPMLSGISSIRLIFCDPPYHTGLAKIALSRVIQSGCCLSGSIICIETEKSEPADLPPPFIQRDQRSYGKSRLTLYQTP